MIIEERQSANGKETYYRFRWGKASSDRLSSGIFTWSKPKTQVEKNHNKEALAILEIKRSQMVIDRQSTGTGYNFMSVKIVLAKTQKLREDYKEFGGPKSFCL
jgi:hypothetical protein